MRLKTLPLDRNAELIILNPYIQEDPLYGTTTKINHIESKNITLITPTSLNIFTQVYEYPRESQSQIV